MDDSLTERWKKFSLCEIETMEVDIQETVMDYLSVHDTDKCLLFKLLAIKFFNKEVFKTMMQNVQNMVKGVKFFKLGDNIVLAQFDKHDKEHVFRNGPWSFDQNLVLLQECNGNFQSSKIFMTLASFWIQLYDLPLKGMTGRILRMIGESIGEIEDVDL